MLTLVSRGETAVSIIMEIRPGVGGDEAALFAKDLLTMYLRHSERVGLGAEVLSSDPIVIRLTGAVAPLSGEAGVHCIQRVSPTDSKGRVHTSTATVAVLPEPDRREVAIPERDLRYEEMRSTGNGGQGAQKTSSRVRVTHVPTGISAVCEDERSQHRNRANALAVLRARLAEASAANARNATDAERRRQFGSGARADRIRTYDIPDDVVADRRLGRKVRGVRRVLRGDLSALLA